MSNLLFTEISLAQQETIAGGGKGINVNTNVNVNTNINTNVAIGVAVGQGNKIIIGQKIQNQA